MLICEIVYDCLKISKKILKNYRINVKRDTFATFKLIQIVNLQIERIIYTSAYAKRKIHLFILYLHFFSAILHASV